MHFVYTLQSAPLVLSKSIFLAGPTPRDANTPSWRPAALDLLAKMGYDGVVFIPEYEGGKQPEGWTYSAQVEWEERYLNMADVILFWVPREMTSMPALTTNVEWGKWLASGKSVLGSPPDAEKMEYLQHDATKAKLPVSSTLESTILAALYQINQGAPRGGGEREVPLHIWNTESFQSWYKAQLGAGNRLDGGRVVWTFRVGKQQTVFYWAFHVKMWIGKEERYKTNEVVISRPDVSTVMAYNDAGDAFQDIKIVLVREFRSPASTPDGFVREFPGGSSKESNVDPLKQAAEELKEETGLQIKASRFKFVGNRQLTSTLSAHHAHFYAVELSAAEMAVLEQQKEPHGVVADSERTYVEVYTLREMLASPMTDWSTLGMVCSVLLGSQL